MEERALKKRFLVFTVFFLVNNYIYSLFFLFFHVNGANITLKDA